MMSMPLARPCCKSSNTQTTNCQRCGRGAAAIRQQGGVDPGPHQVVRMGLHGRSHAGGRPRIQQDPHGGAGDQDEGKLLMPGTCCTACSPNLQQDLTTQDERLSAVPQLSEHGSCTAEPAASCACNVREPSLQQLPALPSHASAPDASPASITAARRGPRWRP